jgi:MFS family permease
LAPSADITSANDVISALPFGKFQKLLFIFHAVMCITTSLLIYNLAFFLMQPFYKCPFIDPDNSGMTLYRECAASEYCLSNPSLDDLRNNIDWTNKYSMINWIGKFDFYCGHAFEISLFGSLFFLGFICSTLIFPPLADTYGRKIFVVGVCAL